MTVPVMQRFFKVTCPTCEDDFMTGKIPPESRIREYFKTVDDARKRLAHHSRYEPGHKPHLIEITRQDITDADLSF